MPELLTGEVTHFYSKLGVAAVNLRTPLHIGDHIHVLGHTTDMEEVVDSMEVDHHKLDIKSMGQPRGVQAEQSGMPSPRPFAYQG